MKLSVASQILPIAAFLIPFASTSADPALEALTARLAAGKLSGEDYDKMESFIDGLERSKMQPLTSVICRLSSFHLGQSCIGNSCMLAPDEFHFVCPRMPPLRLE